MKKLNTLILIISLAAHSLNISAAKLDQAAQTSVAKESRAQKIKQWAQEHKLLTAIATTAVILGIGASGYFLLSKSNEEKNIAMMLDTKKDYKTRLEAVKRVYEDRIPKLQAYLDQFNASPSDDPKRAEIIQKTYPFLPEDTKASIEKDLKKRNPTIEFKKSEDFAKLLTNKRLEELTLHYKDKFRERLDYINDSLRAITDIEKLKEEKPDWVAANYSTPQKIKETIEEDLEWAEEAFVKSE